MERRREKGEGRGEEGWSGVEWGREKEGEKEGRRKEKMGEDGDWAMDMVNLINVV